MTKTEYAQFWKAIGIEADALIKAMGLTPRPKQQRAYDLIAEHLMQNQDARLEQFPPLMPSEFVRAYKLAA